MEIKEQNKDTILCVECGYKYRFFGEDAEVRLDVMPKTELLHTPLCVICVCFFPSFRHDREHIVCRLFCKICMNLTRASRTE